MPQGLLGFQYEQEKTSGGMTALGGLPVFVELAHSLGFARLIEEHLKVRSGGQGWTDDQMLMSLLLLNLAGGDCVDDIQVLESDDGLCRVLREMEHSGLTGSQRRAMKKRWRKKRTRTVPSPTVLREYLELFHDGEQEKLRQPQTAFIPARTAGLLGLTKLNGSLVGQVQRRSTQKVATMDMDATLSETHKKQALYSYKKTKAFQPLNFYWFEQGLIVLSQFRDGNVPANYDLAGPFKESLDLLPEGVTMAFMRSDTAGYQEDLLSYCAQGKNKRFGVIEFAVGVRITQEYKKAVAEVAEGGWTPVYRLVKDVRVPTGQEYAEVCFVPTWEGRKKHGPTYRYLAIRERIEEPAADSGPEQLSLPFPTMGWDSDTYKVSGIVTNRDLPAEEVIWWYRERCGKSEHAHSIMKEDLAGGQFPSGLFGANAAWWQIMILAFNLSQAMKSLVWGEGWINRRMKAIRYHLINVPGRVIEHARRLTIKLVGGHPACGMLIKARRRIQLLCDTS